MLNVIESEKKAMPNDIANLGWRTTAKTGAYIGRSHPATASFQEIPSLRARVLSRPVVAIRMLWTRLAGGSTSSSDFSQRCPSSASTSRGPQTAQAWACAWKLSNLLPLNVCSTASLNSASNSAHFIRSEERRVGKECRSRWSRYLVKKKKQKSEQTEEHK